jgi:hypothetical protein
MTGPVDWSARYERLGLVGLLPVVRELDGREHAKRGVGTVGVVQRVVRELDTQRAGDLRPLLQLLQPLLVPISWFSPLEAVRDPHCSL